MFEQKKLSLLCNEQCAGVSEQTHTSHERACRHLQTEVASSYWAAYDASDQNRKLDRHSRILGKLVISIHFRNI